VSDISRRAFDVFSNLLSGHLFRINVRCIALIYFKDGNDSDYKHDVAQSVISQFGVIAAERSAHKSYVLVVHFDQHLTRSSQIVKSLQKQGFPAMLVGC